MEMSSLECFMYTVHPSTQIKPLPLTNSMQVDDSEIVKPLFKSGLR
jgi:hypothetical protein